MHVGIKIPNWGALAGPQALIETARTAEERGFDSVWVSDHLVVPDAGPDGYPYHESSKPPFAADTPFLDPIATLAYVAAATSRVQLGTGIYVLPLREPVAVAKQVSSLDVLSNGRVLFGVGAGWMPEEFVAVGRSFDERGRNFDLALQTMRACWGTDAAVLPGAAAAAGPLRMSPAPVSGTALPLLIGGHSKAAMRRATRLADGWYASNVDAAEFGALLAQLRGLDDEAAPLLAGVRPGVTADPDDAPAQLRDFAAVGADFVVFDAPFDRLTTGDAVAWVNRLADRLQREPSGATALRSRRDWSVTPAAV